ncbi:MAG: adenosine deaminase family protein [Acidobacteria bacterium]|nr:adenosine deaminase family protein [Acidobacteriota bacterium]
MNRRTNAAGSGGADTRRETDSIPTVDLHRHFEAGLTPETIARLAARHGLSEVRVRSGEIVPGVDPQDPESIRRYYRGIAAGFGGPDGFGRFVDSFGLPLSVLRTLEDLEEAAFDQIVDGADRGSLHTELRGSPFSYQEFVNASIEDIGAALVHGVERAWRERGASGTFLLSFSRQKGLGAAGLGPAGRQAPAIADLAARLHQSDRPVGLDIAGFPETPFPPRRFQEALGPAREAGVPLTVHAGEQGRPPAYVGAPPALIVEAIEALGARRIGHGTSLAASRDARQLVRERGIAIECCPVSNDRLGFVPLAQHPLPLFLDEQLLVSVGTDDPLMFGPFTVAETCDMVASAPGLDGAWRLQLTKNGIESAFVSDERRRWLRRQLAGASERPGAEGSQ